MKVEQIYNIVNGLTKEYVGEQAVVNEDLSNIVDIGFPATIFSKSGISNCFAIFLILESFLIALERCFMLFSMSFVLAAIIACKYRVLPFSSKHFTVSSATMYFLSNVCANATL